MAQGLISRITYSTHLCNIMYTWELYSVLLHFCTLYSTQSKYHVTGISCKGIPYYLFIPEWFPFSLLLSFQGAGKSNPWNWFFCFLASTAHRRNAFEKFCSWSEVFKLYFIVWACGNFWPGAGLHLCEKYSFCSLGLSEDTISAGSSFVLSHRLLSSWCTVLLPPQASSSRPSRRSLHHL